MGVWRPMRRRLWFIGSFLSTACSSTVCLTPISAPLPLFKHQVNRETLFEIFGRTILFVQDSIYPEKSQVNKETLLEIFGRTILFVQDNSYPEKIQADVGTRHRLNFMATTLAEAPVLEKKENGVVLEEKKLHVIFVLGGPGSGKGTQCANIVENFGFTHLSAGDLLRAEIISGSENGTMIQNMIKDGKIVPSEVTIKLLQKAMQEIGNDKFLIDGFPRNEENRAAFEKVTGIEPDFILFFDCPNEEMEKRLLNRNQGRVDDNIETIRKRFKVFMESSLPVIDYYESKGKVRKIDATGTKEDIFEKIKVLFEPFTEEKKTENDVNN